MKWASVTLRWAPWCVRVITLTARLSMRWRPLLFDLMLDKTYNRGQWFGTQSLHQSIDRVTWDRGLTLYLTQKVLRLAIEPLGADWLLLAAVQGSARQPYEVSIELTLTADGRVENWDSDCTCPVGYQCKHGVAVMLKAAQQGLRLMDGAVASKFTTTPPSPEQIETERQAALARALEKGRQEAEAP